MTRSMNPRLKKLIGLVAILAFCTAYIVTVISIGVYIPQHWAWQGLFYGVTGIVWGLPLFPLITWMNRED